MAFDEFGPSTRCTELDGVPNSYSIPACHMGDPASGNRNWVEWRAGCKFCLWCQLLAASGAIPDYGRIFSLSFCNRQLALNRLKFCVDPPYGGWEQSENLCRFSFTTLYWIMKMGQNLVLIGFWSLDSCMGGMQMTDGKWVFNRGNAMHLGGTVRTAIYLVVLSCSSICSCRQWPLLQKAWATLFLF